jgi:protein-L-isoaspartate(D-aspartate) O-methyltransferase
VDHQPPARRGGHSRPERVDWSKLADQDAIPLIESVIESVIESLIESRIGSMRGSVSGSGAMPTTEWLAEQQKLMVEGQLRHRGIRDERVLQAMAQAPRHEFVSWEHRRQAYEDHPVAIGQGQTISQPYIVASMLEALELKETERALEVGTGSGYQAALLARLAAHVYTIEYDPLLAGSAEQRLREMGLADSVTVVCGDGSLGYPPAAPYDGIVVAAAAPEIPRSYLDQLVDGGRLVIPVGSLECQELRQVRKFGNQTVSRMLGYCRFVPLRGKYGWEEF